jgi:V-type H+-transporting ATPase subunit D
VANKKQRDTAEADAEMKAKRQALADQENVQPEKDTGPSDILTTGDDEDVIF